MNRVDGRTGTHGRHQTLDAMIGWSYELLTQSEQRLFQRLAVFENGWTIDTALTVCAEPQQSRADVLGLLGSGASITPSKDRKKLATIFRIGSP